MGLIEWHLKILARLHIYEPPGNKKQRSEFENAFFGPTGAVSSLSMATKFCIANRLIDDDMYLAIEKMRKIRNPFAHSFDDARFDDPDVEKLLGELPKDCGMGEEIKNGVDPGEIQIAFADVGETADEVRAKLGESGPQSVVVSGCWQKLQFIHVATAVEDRIMQNINSQIELKADA